MKDLGDKLAPEDKSAIDPLLQNLKTALQGTDTDAIKNASEALNQKFYEISAKLYQNAGPQGAPQGDPTAGQQGADGAYNADYNVVDDDNNNQQ